MTTSLPSSLPSSPLTKSAAACAGGDHRGNQQVRPQQVLVAQYVDTAVPRVGQEQMTHDRHPSEVGGARRGVEVGDERLVQLGIEAEGRLGAPIAPEVDRAVALVAERLAGKAGAAV